MKIIFEWNDDDQAIDEATSLANRFGAEIIDERDI
jgi:hypothetical protein